MAAGNSFKVLKALIGLRQQLDPYGTKLLWDPSGDYCSFKGVTCGTPQGVYGLRVPTALKLSGLGLIGTIPDDSDLWNNLGTLQKLDLSNNNLKVGGN